jgi:hypothetical protein
VKNLFFNSGTGFQPVKSIPNMIFKVWELENMARMAMSRPDASPTVLHMESQGQHDNVCTLCAYAPMFLCTFKLALRKITYEIFNKKMQNEANPASHKASPGQVRLVLR